MRDNVKKMIFFFADAVKRKTPPAIHSTKPKTSEVSHVFSKNKILKKSIYHKAVVGGK